MLKIKTPSLLRNTYYSFIIVIISIININFCFAQKNNFDINESSTTIIVFAYNYSLSIDKHTAIVTLTNTEESLYTSFPLSYQLALNDTQNVENHSNYQWKIKDKKISLTVASNSEILYKFEINCFKASFEIKLGIIPPESNNTGIYFFKTKDKGFDIQKWDQYFSPEPDDYYSNSPAIDIRTDRDQQWFQTPAPLNLSFKTDANWFSIGLAQLPDASIYTFKNNALWLDIPWEKLNITDSIHWLPSFIFTFNKSPWNAVGDYRNHLNKNNGINTTKKALVRSTKWWTHPFVSTWGEQIEQKIIYDHPDFNSEWVKNYVELQEKALPGIKFTLIIENKWSQIYGDPQPSANFSDLRSLIDWCHKKGHKVILNWKAWEVEAKSMAIALDIVDGHYLDSTNPMFYTYVDSCCQILFGNGEEELNADGLKITNLFNVRDPKNATYNDPATGIGFRETHHYLSVFYKTAKKYKSNCLIMSSAVAPHYSDIQDMVRINDDWDNKLRREKRARIINQSLPDMLICGDAADMSNKIALYHYTTSSIYGIPAIYYLNQFHDGKIPEKSNSIIYNLLKLMEDRPIGKIEFVNYGNWMVFKKKNNQLLAESITGGKGIILYRDNKNATFFCTENSNIHLIFENHELDFILDENKKTIQFKDIGHGIYETDKIEQGKFYQLKLKKVTRIH